jgi:tRNA nucleotidyltransferase (CCA-adding enzyme)
MELIVAHESADFDAFAAAALARRLYPGAVYVVTGGLARGVREFATLHRDRFAYVEPSAIDLAAVTRVILVDMRRLSRLAKLPALRDRIAQGDRTLDVHVWDHHAATREDAPASMAVVAKVGSATTLLLEALRAKELSIDPVEATLCALAIHADTGSLTFASSTFRDADALAWLMGQGADLRVIARYLQPPWSAGQRAALELALDSLVTESIHGLSVGFSRAVIPTQTEGLDEVASELLHLAECHALFTLWSQGTKVRVIARSRSDALDLSLVLRALGGGGHPTAATAAVAIDPATDSLASVRERIEGVVRAMEIPVLRVRDVMSSPVHTVGPELSLARLRETFVGGRLSGVPVVRGDVLAGIVCRADLERAERRGDPRVSVAGIMRQPVRTTTEETTVEDALGEMTRWDVGRLPVLRGSELVGIVTRTDLRRVLYGG